MAQSTVEHTEEGVGVAKEAPIRILHVDDEASFLKVAKPILEMQGNFHVETATSVEEALDKVKQKKYDAVVSDYVMPEKNGLEFLKELRESGNKVPFILLTGKGREEVAIEALNLGADRYINKIGPPQTVFYELAHEIQQVSEKWKAEGALDLQRNIAVNLLGATNLTDSVNKLFDEFLDLKEFDCAGFYLVDKEAGDLDMVLHRGLPEKFVEKVEHLDGASPYAKVAMEGKSVFAKASDFPPAIKEDLEFEGILSVAAIPIQHRGEVVADLNLASHTHSEIPIFTRKVIESVCAQIGEAIIRVRTEEALKESEQKYRALVERAADGIAIVQGKFLKFSNQRLAEMLGYEVEELIDSEFVKLIPPENRELMVDRNRRRQAGEEIPSIYELPVLKKTGERIEVEVNTGIIQYEEKPATIVVIRDIAERKRVEEENRKSEKRYEALFNTLADPIAIVGSKGKVLAVNDRVLELTGFKREELVGTNFLRTRFLSRKAKVDALKVLAKRMIGIQIPPYEVEVLTSSGNKITTEVKGAKIEYEGKPASLVVLRDISERKKMEDKLRVVGKMTRHDVRNKLSAIRANIFLAEKKLGGNNDGLKHLWEIDASVGLVERIFDFARTYERVGMEKLAYVNVEKSLREAVILFSDLNDMKVINDCSGLVVFADSLLRQVFYNLIHNSLKHGKNVGKIRVYFKEENDELKLIYEDDGIGIPKKDKEKIFEEGYGKGTGYGLYLIRKMCEVYEWTIKETGQYGKGAKFTLTIPRLSKEGRENYRIK